MRVYADTSALHVLLDGDDGQHEAAGDPAGVDAGRALSGAGVRGCAVSGGGEDALPPYELTDQIVPFPGSGQQTCFHEIVDPMVQGWSRASS